MSAPPLHQTQVQFPIIGNLADDFEVLIAGVNSEVRSLSDNHLRGLKTLLEEKLKSKGTPITIPSSADELISFISQYCNCLNIELVQLVVQYLGQEHLQAQLKRYEEMLKIFRTEITVNAELNSFSLQRILKTKDFLVHQLGIDRDSIEFIGFPEGVGSVTPKVIL